MDNTGRKIYRWLREIDANTGQPTGNRKPNLPSDPDYIAPMIDYISCPLPSTSNPTVTIRWSDINAPSNVYADRICESTNCGYQINIDALDSDGDIITKEVLVSYDFGATWITLITNITGMFFIDSLSGFSSKWYKVLVTDTQPVTGASNILKISAVEIGIGDLVMVYNGVEYAPFNNTTPFAVTDADPISFMIRNRSTTQIVRMHDISPFGLTNIACTVETLGGTVVNGIYTSRPQVGQFITVNNGWLPLLLSDITPGNYIIRVAVEFPQDTGFPPLYLYTYFWWITIS